MGKFFVYMLKCADESFYIGLTSDILNRLTEHEQGLSRKAYTYSRRPVELVWVGDFPTHDEAFTFERQIKGWSRAKKKALIDNDWDEIHQIVKNERKRRDLKKRGKASNS